MISPLKKIKKNNDTVVVLFQSIYWLLVYLPPLKNMKVSWDDDIPNIWKNKTCSIYFLYNHKNPLQDIWEGVRLLEPVMHPHKPSPTSALASRLAKGEVGVGVLREC